MSSIHAEYSQAFHEEKAVRTLAVDDDKTMRMILQSQLENLGHKVITACNGKEAWEILQKDKGNIDLVLLDREMPEMNGLEVVALMHKDPKLKDIPTIMQTGSDRPEQIKQGIDAGIYYYLTKPIDKNVLESVLSAAVREIRQKKVLNSELKQHKISFNLIDTCKFSYRTLPEAESLACFIANCYDNAERMVSGLAELLINAIEHGNLGIGYTEKTWLIKAGTWRDEIAKRVDLPEHINKTIKVVIWKKDDGTYVRITDQGTGFEWQKFLQIDPSRAQDNHGRGIAQANAISFTNLEYNNVGNEVTAYLSNEPELDW